MIQPDKPAVTAGRPRGRRRIWAVCVVTLAAIAGSTIVTLLPVSAGNSSLREVRRASLGLQQVADLRTTLFEFQLLLEPSLAVSQPESTSAINLAKAAILTQSANTQTQTLLRLLPTTGLGRTAHDLMTASSAFTKAYTGLAPLASGLPVAKATAPIAAERAAFTELVVVTTTAQVQLQLSTTPGLRQGINDLGVSRVTLLVVAALAALATLAAAFVYGQRFHRRERTELRNAQRQLFTGALQEALEMAAAEPDVYAVVNKALRQSLPKLQVEMLVADSSRAHFHQALTTAESDPPERSGCDVASPLDCPATIRGHTLVFATSSALNACPRMQGRASGGCSAVCVPISIAGKTVGVTHAVGDENVTPREHDIRHLEITSRRASERIGMLRAFEESETQARSDPLTGLSNRRSLENRVRDLQREGVPYGLAYGDLDHFKILNDTHGHEAGDQALRLFSRVLRDSIRPTDIAARYGGEEFVLILPGSNTDVGTSVLERVRENLALALTAGRVAPFTVSFGLASSFDADTFEDVVAVADRALLAAKAAGRNRVTVAAGAVPPLPAA